MQQAVTTIFHARYSRSIFAASSALGTSSAPGRASATDTGSGLP